MQLTSSILNSRTFKVIKRIVNIFIVIVIIFLCLSTINIITERQSARTRFADFFESNQEYDVLFFGSSHMLHAVNPMQLWKEYGLRSYNFAGPATWVPGSYWLFRNAINYHKPQIAVLEVFNASVNIEHQDISMLHNTFDAFPLSYTKFLGICELVQDKAKREELLIPFSLYHSRWEEIQSADIDSALKIRVESVHKGAQFLVDIYKDATYIDIEYKPTTTENLTDSQKYVLRFIETCKSFNIIPVLLYVPYDVQINEDWINPIISELNIYYLDMYGHLNDYINYKTDFADRAHLNFLGDHKTTNEIGVFLSEIINNQFLDNQTIEQWEYYYKKYMDDIKTRIMKANNLNEILLYMCDSCIEGEIVYGKDIYRDDIASNLIRELQNCKNIVLRQSDFEGKVYLNITIDNFEIERDIVIPA